MPGYRKGVPAVDKGRRRPPEPLTRDEVLAILRATDPSLLGGCRDRALIVLLWRTGLRIKEALDLEPWDLDLAAGFLRVRHGKGDKDRVVAIDPAAVPHITAWLDRRAAIPHLPPRAPVFCTFTQPFPGEPIGAPQVRGRLKLLAERAGVEKRVHPHGFRHTHATELAMEGIPLNVIKDQLGHDSLAVTERYIARLAPTERLKKMHDRPGFDA
jgi:integrase/recombinase XerD